VQEALLAAAMQWPRDGLPDNPRGWLIQVGARRMTDYRHSEEARRRRETEAAAAAAHLAPEAAVETEPDQDDTLTLFFMCCHPSLTPSSAIALTLRAVGGLTTAEITHAFLVPEATMAQRISRAKASIKASGVPFQLPTTPERAQRLRTVLHVLYLIFNEGYTSSAGAPSAAARTLPRGHPPGTLGSRPATRRRGGGRLARLDAADRRPPRGPHRTRRGIDSAH